MEVLTSGLAFKAASNCFTSSGGDIWSISAPSIDRGTLTPENYFTISDGNDEFTQVRFSCMETDVGVCSLFARIVKYDQKEEGINKQIYTRNVLPWISSKDTNEGCRSTPAFT